MVLAKVKGLELLRDWTSPWLHGKFGVGTAVACTAQYSLALPCCDRKEMQQHQQLAHTSSGKLSQDSSAPVVIQPEFGSSTVSSAGDKHVQQRHSYA